MEKEKECPKMRSKVLKASAVILSHAGISCIAVKEDSITLRLRNCDHAEDIIRRLSDGCGNVEKEGDNLTIRKDSCPETFKCIKCRIIEESLARDNHEFMMKTHVILSGGSSDRRKVAAAVLPIFDKLTGFEKTKSDPDLIGEVSELVEANDDSNLRIGLGGIAQYHGADGLKEAVRVLKEVKHDVGRVAFYLGMNPGVAPWDFIAMLELVEANKDSKEKLWDLCNDIDSGYPSPDIKELVGKYGNGTK